eukprot:CAMPEP_0184045148 /NCGR_PEP_ID=MMETSP0956-20121227/726_1 /TAXON_ID=627963 /ORGANISM="Aplanochytrium sp, Strain PBS07" /LENGTH=80 /DNA_ID=CAMNT_0026336361 /DNA_START=432 /DNA_END=670 /DNA_ORIENTATION=+
MTKLYCFKESNWKDLHLSSSRITLVLAQQSLCASSYNVDCYHSISTCVTLALDAVVTRSSYMLSPSSGIVDNIENSINVV